MEVAEAEVKLKLTEIDREEYGEREKGTTTFLTHTRDLVVFGVQARTERQ